MAGLMIGIIGAVSGLNVSRALTETKYKEVQICYAAILYGISPIHTNLMIQTHEKLY